MEILLINASHNSIFIMHHSPAIKLKLPPTLHTIIIRRIKMNTQLEAFRKRRAFDPASWVADKLEKCNAYFRKHGLKGAVISVSGGIDSAVVFALCKRAAAIEKVIAVAQPIHSTESIWKRALELGAAFDHPIIVIDQTDLCDHLVDKVRAETHIPKQPFAEGQLRSYMRTPVNYYLAQLYTCNGIPSIVMGTGNYDEDGYLYYFCKAGDGVVDLALISDLHKSEVYQVARYLGVPESICTAAPSADLWEGQTDESELGVSYDFVELYTEYLKCSEMEQMAIRDTFSPDEKEVFAKNEARVVSIHNRNKHKVNFPVCL